MARTNKNSTRNSKKLSFGFSTMPIKLSQMEQKSNSCGFEIETYVLMISGI